MYVTAPFGLADQSLMTLVLSAEKPAALLLELLLATAFRVQLGNVNGKGTSKSGLLVVTCLCPPPHCLYSYEEPANIICSVTAVTLAGFVICSNHECRGSTANIIRA